MTGLVYRQTKGSALTYGELDGNFTEINRRTGAGWSDAPMEITVQSGALDAPTYSEFEEGFQLYAFSPDVYIQCRADIHLNHDYTPATMLYPHTHFTTNVDASGVVRFGFSWKYACRSDSPSGVIKFTPVQTIYIEYQVNLGEVGFHQVAEPSDGNGIYRSDLDVDGILMCKFFRDGGHSNDTFPGQVFFIKADAHYQTDKANTPLRTPPFFP